MSEPRRIGDLIETPPVKTVIRLDEGKESPAEIAGSFVFTSEVSAHLNVISESLRQGRGRGYFLQGDFGSGKSHFLAAVYAWLAGAEGTKQLCAAHQGLKQASDTVTRILPVAVSLIDYRSGTSLETILLESVERALAAAGRQVSLTPFSAFLARLKELVEDPEAGRTFAGLAGVAEEGRRLSDWISEHPRQAYTAGLRLVKKLGLEEPRALVEERKETFQRLFEELAATGFGGLMLLIDELSEFFRSKPTAQALNEDARTLQFLGELAGRRPLWILAAVQESIERTGDIAQAILRKIKDRFPVKLALSTVHIRALISGRLVRKKPGAEEEIYRIYEHYRRQFSTFSCSFDEFLITYPVHPDTVSLLDGLGELFSQHRGIVDFVYSRIAGDSSRGIPSLLERPPKELLGPDSIYEHFAGRLAEVSTYNIYPRHIIPHLDGEIDRVIEDGEDRRLARRLVRMLVLFRIHPTADNPTAAKLAELAACSLDLPEMNARFVAEALLDPLADSSRFLRRIASGDTAGGEPSLAVYEISSEEDSTRVLEARISRIVAEIPDDDGRLLAEPLLGLPESDSWPGPALVREAAVREVTWNLSRRRALVRFLHGEEPVPPGLASELEARNCDFVLLLSLGRIEPAEEHFTVWRIPLPEQGEALAALKESLAVRLAREELSASNPAHAPLIPLAAERSGRLKPAAAQAALEAFYAGEFSDSRIRVDAAVRQLKRFDSLLEAAGQVALAARYPRFAEVAPRRYTPSPRIYQQLLESFVIPASLPLSEARPLSAAIDGLMFPLGLVELKRGSYVFSPDITGHPLLVFFFEHLRPSAAVALREVLERLTRGVFGLPRDTALFLVASLAAGGLITVRKGGRAVALEYLSLQNVERAEEIALGELIGEHDRATLLEECGFLSSTGDLGSFGLRQQRAAWKEVISFRSSAEHLAADSLSRLAQRREYSSFRGFAFTALEEKLQALAGLAASVKVSYSAKEGLEAFLAAWRASGLDADTVQFLKKLDRFLKREAEKFVFVHHYVQHEAAEKAAAIETGLAPLRLQILELLQHPEQRVVPDEGAELDRLFAVFRDRYIPVYAGLHDGYYERLRPPSLSKNASRALQVLNRLAAVEALDRPPGLDRFLAGLLSTRSGQCHRQIREELMRAPVCGCGFLPGQLPDEARRADPEREIDRYLEEYLDILRMPGVLEALGTHAYAVQDLKPRSSAHLKELAAGLESGSLSPSGLVGSLDESCVRELAGALSGAVRLRRVSLEGLIKRLAGRRLPAEKILGLVSEWLGTGREGELLAVEGASPTAAAAEPDSLQWWALLRAGYFPRLAPAGGQLARLAGELEAKLEERFPSARLEEPLRGLSQAELALYIRSEPLHTRAARKAWQLLAGRVLSGAGPWRTESAAAAPGRSESDGGKADAGDTPRSSHVDPEQAVEIEERLERVERIALTLALAFPGRLALRPELEALTADPWAGEDLKAKAASVLEQTISLGDRWLRELSPVEPIDLGEGPLVLLVDGAAPDLWLQALDRIEAFPERLTVSWSRLETEAETVPATAGLFGLEGDPVEALEAMGVAYLRPGSREEEGFPELLSSLLPGTAAVVRLGILDRSAHQGVCKLAELAALLRHLLQSGLPAAHRLCSTQKRNLVLTTDHGLSLTPEGLSHGRGGVYERAIFRARWTL
jgi:hypothetical protein